MEQERLRDLLDRYYEGMTSEKEEEELKAFYADGKWSDGQRDPLLEVIDCMSVPDPSDDFSRRLEKTVTAVPVRRGLRRSLILTLSAAAGVALFTGTYLLFSEAGRDTLRDTYSDPELAMAEVKEVLYSVSRNMRAGTAPLKTLKTINIAPATLNEMGRINSEVENSLARLRYLNNPGTVNNEKQ